MRLWLPIVGLLVSVPALAASHAMRVELNTLEAAETSCRMTFVIENPDPQQGQPRRVNVALR